MAILYRHIRLDKNEPFYIGIGTDVKRAYSKDCRNDYWKHITNKTDYEVQILFDDLTWEEACEKEKEFIALYGRKDLCLGTLCNMTDGGEGIIGYRHTDEIKKKISLLNIGNKNMFGKKHSEVTKLKISKCNKGHCRNKGEDHPSFGKTQSIDWVEKRMVKIRGRKNISISNSLFGNKRALGNKLSDETKMKMSKNRKGKPAKNSKIVLDLQTGIFYNSIKELSILLSLPQSTLNRQLNNKYKNKYMIL